MMENVWEGLKSLQGKSWSETKNIFDKIAEDLYPIEDAIETYCVNAETLPEQDREIYGLHLKNEPFFLERCKICSRLLKASVIDQHIDVHHRKNGATISKKCTFISSSKKKHPKRSHRSASEDDCESFISSETSSPNVDLPESNDSNISMSREECMVDVIAAEELLVGEESKPPTPGPHDLYEEFAVPYSEETSNSLSSVGDSNDSLKSSHTYPKPIKLKIFSNKDGTQKLQTTSLLEAHLLSNTKYNTSSGVENTDLLSVNLGYRFDSSSTSKCERYTEQSQFRTCEESCDRKDLWASSSSLLQPSNSNNGCSLMKADTKISIPISVIPQSVKISGSMKKPHCNSLKSALPKTSHKLIDAKELPTERTQLSSQFNVVVDRENRADLSPINSAEEKLLPPSKSRKSKRSETRNRLARTTDFEPDKHCGVLIDGNKRCVRSLTCKTHLVSLRRAVPGRSKKFDELLAEHRASKEALKEQDRNQNMNTNESVVSLPSLKLEKMNGSSIQIVRKNFNLEATKNHNNNCGDSGRIETELEVQNKENERKMSKKLTSNVKQSVAAFSNIKTCNTSRQLSPTNLPIDENVSSFYNNDIKVSFVCSNTLYKIGGLLYTDRSRQAVRKCVAPLMCNGLEQNTFTSRRSSDVVVGEISNFLRTVKNGARPNTRVKLNLLKQRTVQEVKLEDYACTLQTNGEIDRMKNVLGDSKKIISILSSSDDSGLRKLKLIRRKRPLANQYRSGGSANKKIKRECMSDENYDINSLFFFEKCMPQRNIGGGGGGGSSGISSISSTGSGGRVAPSPNVSTDTFLHSFHMDVDAECIQNIDAINGKHEENGSATSKGSSSDNVTYTDGENVVATGAFTANDSYQLWQTFRDLENEIQSTVHASSIQELYAAQPDETMVTATVATETYRGATTDLTSVRDTVNGPPIDPTIPNIEETISKNYSLLEEYCKNITTDQLLSEGKSDYDFLDGSVQPPNDRETKANRNSDIRASPAAGVVIDTASTLGNVYSNVAKIATDYQLASGELTLDAHVLRSYLPNISGNIVSQSAANRHNEGDPNLVDDQFRVQLEKRAASHPPISPSDCQERPLTLNKQFPGMC